MRRQPPKTPNLSAGMLMTLLRLSWGGQGCYGNYLEPLLRRGLVVWQSAEDPRERWHITERGRALVAEVIEYIDPPHDEGER